MYSENTSLPSSAQKGSFVLHGMDLNQDFVSKVDATITAEDLARLDREIEGHWIFDDQVYRSATFDLVKAAREVHAAAKFSDTRSDLQLAASILESLGLLTSPKPTGVWASAKFLTRFLAAYGRLHIRAEIARARFARDVLKNEAAPVSH